MSGPVWLITAWGLTGLTTGAVLSSATRRLLQPTRPQTLLSATSLAPITALLFGLLAWRVGLQPELLADSWLAAIAAPLAAADITTRRLPNALLLPSYPAVLALLAAAAAVHHDGAPLLRATAGMAVLLALYGLPYYLLPGAIAGGDVKLAGVLGLILGWTSWPTLLTGTLLGWMLAAVTCLVVRSRNNSVPLGAFLIAGTLVALLASSPP